MELYSFRKGHRKFEQQIDAMNVPTKNALMQILYNFNYNISDQNIIITAIKSFHYINFKNSISENYILGLEDIKTSDDINDFLEIVLKTLHNNHRLLYYNTDDVINLIDRIWC